MRRFHRCLLVATVVVITAVAFPATALAAPTLPPNEFGAQAYSYIEQLAVEQREPGTPGELAAAAKVGDWFAAAGYGVSIQPFACWDWEGNERSSQNVVAYRPATKKPTTGVTPLVIVGAHYDSVPIPGDLGADDNASGVSVMLEVAERIARYNQEYDIAFVAFGAEEIGLWGSFHYVSQMSEEDLSRTIAMINMDCLIVGDKLYLHAGNNQQTWVRDEMLRLIRLHKLPIGIQPGWCTYAWVDPIGFSAGFTPDWFSDYTAFNQAGIPVVSLESTNWEIFDCDGWIQTEEYGSFWHSPYDNLEDIEEHLPGRPLAHLNAFTTLVFEFLKHLDPASVPELDHVLSQSSENAAAIHGGQYKSRKQLLLR